MEELNKKEGGRERKRERKKEGKNKTIG